MNYTYVIYSVYRIHPTKKVNRKALILCIVPIHWYNIHNGRVIPNNNKQLYNIYKK